MFQASAPATGAGAFVPGSAATNATSIVELSISARNLRDMDVFSKSDPMCVVYVKPFGSDSFVEFKRTECVKNCLNPDFTTKPHMSYYFEEQQHLMLEVYDLDSSSQRLTDHDFIGRCLCTLGQIVSAGKLVLDLVNPEHSTGNGELIVSCEELSMCKDEIELQFMGKKLDKKDFFGSSDPFLQLSRANETGGFTIVHRTEHVKNNVNPVWQKFVVPVRTLCNGDLDRNIKVECYDHNKSGNHSFIGEFYTTVRQLSAGPGEQNSYFCINPKKQQKKSNYKNSGLIVMIHCEKRKSYTFLDYVQGGTELACTISIDFTASNGNPTNPDSLHFYSQYGGGTVNQYEMAIRAVGDIIEDYDSDKLFPVLGFGARLPPDGQISHNFFVNGHPSNPYCERIDGVLAAYKSCLTRIQLYGPTNFAPTINHVANIAQNFTDGSQYFILLIITDGIITDMPQTKKAIVAASTLPLSIIIVGVGNADFDAMEELDGDTVRLTAPDGRVAARDIVQFVPFRNFTSKHGLNSPQAKLYLAREVLAEIPDQFLGYMKSKRLVPRNPPEQQSSVRALPPDPEVFGRNF